MRENSSPVRQISASTAARQGHSFRPLAADAASRARRQSRTPKGGRSAAAGADIAPAKGRGRFAPMPHATRGGRGTAPLKRQFSRYRKRGVRGCRGCRGDFPLSPHAPRRAGDLPPMPGSSRDAQGTPAQYDLDVLPFSKLNCSIIQTDAARATDTTAERHEQKEREKPKRFLPFRAIQL